LYTCPRHAIAKLRTPSAWQGCTLWPSCNEMYTPGGEGYCGGTNCAQGGVACDWPGQAGQIWGSQRISFRRGDTRIHDPSHTSLGQRLIHHLLAFQASCFLVQRIPLLRTAAGRFSSLSQLFLALSQPALPIDQSTFLSCFSHALLRPVTSSSASRYPVRRPCSLQYHAAWW